MEQERRRFIANLTRILGSGAALITINATHVSAALAYQRSLNSSLRAGALLNLEQMQILHDVCQTIIPKTDTPGAADLDCHGFIDHQLSVVHTAAQQRAVIAVLRSIHTISNAQFKLSFTGLNDTQKQQCLENIERGKWGDTKLIENFKFLKSLTAFGYFTSEIGATKVLNYQPVPGGYRGSIPFTNETRNYGSHARY
ncbi:gluconate 2-dehydrogenase subunit 3 family protein [Thalassotalea litorea]|uniref:gluconate 2-dehydrogenase subunit 3 family protein n=1 Tax=Thalassotalea litorea TaxID=2020715 RepID=UPI0037369B39